MPQLALVPQLTLPQLALPPSVTSPNWHFPKCHFPNWHFPQVSLPPTGTFPNWHFPKWQFPQLALDQAKIPQLPVHPSYWFDRSKFLSLNFHILIRGNQRFPQQFKNSGFTSDYYIFEIFEISLFLSLTCIPVEYLAVLFFKVFSILKSYQNERKNRTAKL